MPAEVACTATGGGGIRQSTCKVYFKYSTVSVCTLRQSACKVYFKYFQYSTVSVCTLRQSACKVYFK